MKLLLLWMLGVPAVVVSMVIVSQTASCRGFDASLTGPSMGRCLVLAPIRRGR